MAARTNIVPDIDLNLRLLAADVADLDVVLRTWDDEPVPELLAFEMEWRVIVVKLNEIEQLQDTGMLTDEQCQRYQAIMRRVEPHVAALQERTLAIPSRLSGAR